MRELERKGIETSKTDEVEKVSVSKDLETRDVTLIHKKFFISHSCEDRALVNGICNEKFSGHQSAELGSDD